MCSRRWIWSCWRRMKLLMMGESCYLGLDMDVRPGRGCRTGWSVVGLTNSGGSVEVEGLIRPGVRTSRATE